MLSLKFRWVLVYAGLIAGCTTPGSLTDEGVIKAPDLIVAKDGTGDYTSISLALFNCKPGDLISVLAGIYEENIRIAKDGVRLMGAGPERTIVKAYDVESHVVSVQANDVVVQGFAITGGNYGVEQAGGFAGLSVRQNVVSRNNAVGVYLKGSRATVVNNVVTENNWWGIYVEPTATHVVIINNIVTLNVDEAFSLDVEAGHKVEFNCIWQNKGVNDGGGPSETNFEADPGFIDADAGDYRLAKDSPCRAKGEYGLDVGAFPGVSVKRGVKPAASPVTELMHVLVGHQGKVRSVAVNRDGKRLVTGDEFGVIKIWDLDTGYLVKTVEGAHGSFVNGLAFAPGGKFVSAGSDGTAKVWHTKSGEVLHNLEGHTDLIVPVVVSPDGKIVATGSFDRTIRIWDIFTGQLVTTLYGHDDSVWSLAFSLDGQLLASGDSDDRILVWDTKNWGLVKTLTTNSDYNWVDGLVFDRTGEKLYAAGYDNKIYEWDLGSENVTRTLPGHDDHVWSVRLSPGGEVLISSGADGTVRFWDLKTGLGVLELVVANAPVFGLQMSASGEILVAGADDAKTTVWGVAGLKKGKRSVSKLPVSRLQLDAAFSDQEGNDNDAIDDSEEGRIRVTIRNKGNGAAFGVRLNLDPPDDGSGSVVLGPDLFELGMLSSGESREMTIPVLGTASLTGKPLKFRLEVSDVNKESSAGKTLKIETRRSVPSNLACIEFRVDDDRKGASYGNDDGLVQPNEQIELSVNIQNSGAGTAERVTATLRSNDPNVIIKVGFANVGTLGPGDAKHVDFLIAVNRRLMADELDLELRLSEVRPKLARNQPLAVPVGGQGDAPDQLTEIKIIGDYTEPDIRIKSLPKYLTVDLENPRKIKPKGEKVSEIDLPEKDKIRDR